MTSFFLWDTSTRAALVGMISSSGRTLTPRTGFDREREIGEGALITRYGLATSSEVLEKEGLLPFRMLYTYGEDRNQVKFHFNTIVTIAKTTMIIITGAQGGKLEEGIGKTVDP